MPHDCEAYLSRIRCPRPPRPSAAALRTVHRRHLMAVPFENVDVLRGIPLGTTGEDVLDKVVTGSRGGLCFELNRAFHWLLTRLGFQVTLAGAEVHDGDGYVTGIEHPVLLVAVDGQTWLADVGFGALSFVDPLRLGSSAPQRQHGAEYRIDVEDGHRVVLARFGDREWATLFRLMPSARGWADFDDVRAFHETSPRSPFTRDLVCYKASAGGQVALAGRHRTLLRGARLVEQELDEAGQRATLAWILRG